MNQSSCDDLQDLWTLLISIVATSLLVRKDSFWHWKVYDRKQVYGKCSRVVYSNVLLVMVILRRVMECFCESEWDKFDVSQTIHLDNVENK